MNGSFDFVTTTDKPALIAFSSPAWMETAKAVLSELGYKVHTAATHSDPARLWRKRCPRVYRFRLPSVTAPYSRPTKWIVHHGSIE